MAINGLPMGDIPDSDILPEPPGQMYEFYEGLDSNLFSESTGINHNSAPKWLKAEVARHLEFLSYLLSVVNKQAIMSDNIVHTDAIIDDNVTLLKLEPSIRNIIENISLIKVFERNSVQTSDAISVSNGKIRVKQGTIISQSNGFNVRGQDDAIETLNEVDITQTTGNSTTGYLYKVLGGAYSQYTSKQSIIDRETMIGTKVYLGSFTVDSGGLVTSVVPAIPTLFTRTIEEPVISGQYIVMPSGTTAQRPTLDSNTKAIRYNETLETWESWNGSFWGDLGNGQLLGSTQQKAVMFMSQSIVGDLAIPEGCNGMSIGRVTIEAGSRLTVPAGSVYKII